MDDLVGKLSFHDLIAGVSGFGMKIWGGAIHAGFATRSEAEAADLPASDQGRRPRSPAGREANVQAIKNTLLGKASFEMNGAGASFNSVPATQNLKAKGKLKVENAVFATIDVGKMVADGLNGAIDKIAEKLPAGQGQEAVNGVPGGKESKYDR